MFLSTYFNAHFEFVCQMSGTPIMHFNFQGGGFGTISILKCALVLWEWISEQVMRIYIYMESDKVLTLWLSG